MARRELHVLQPKREVAYFSRIGGNNPTSFWMPGWVKFAILQRMAGKYMFGALMKEPLMRGVK